MKEFVISEVQAETAVLVGLITKTQDERKTNEYLDTDMLHLPESSYAYLKGLDCLVMNALRIEYHWTHQSLSAALEQTARIAAGKTYFIHMSHQIGLHAEVQEQLPENVFLTYDGLVIEWDEAGEKK